MTEKVNPPSGGLVLLTAGEVRVLVSLIDAGVRASGLEVFTRRTGAVLQSALVKMEAMASYEVQEPAPKAHEPPDQS